MGLSGDSGDESDSAWRPPAPGAEQVEELTGYAALEQVGRGGDSVVYRARQIGLEREVAIKVLLVDDETRAARFAREAEITVDLGRQHPNIVTVLATGTTVSGRPAIVMDFHEGGTLHDRLKAHGPLPVEEVGRIGEVLADALSFAHERGILHRDVKPQNILVLPTSWVLADFGIARLIDSEHTQSAETFTYRHAAPQILDGYPPTAADDIWSLGSTLYTLLDGRPPFASEDPDDDSALAYLRRARTEPHRPLDAPGTERIAPIIDRCLSKDIDDRWTSAAQLREAFVGLRGSAWEPGASPDAPPSPDRTAPRPAERRVDLSPAPTPTPTPTPTSVPAPVPVPAMVSLAPEPLREPAPVALSAASQAAGVRDADPTGTGLPDRTGSSPEHPGAHRRAEPELEEDEPRSRRRVPLILGAAALTIGLTLGLAGAAMRGAGDDDSTAPTTPTPTDVIPSLDSLPTDLPTYRGRFNPDLDFVLREVATDGTNVHAEWSDPSEGEGIFILWQTFPETKLVDDIPAGRTTWDVTDALPKGRNCFYMVVRLATGELGKSKEYCFQNRFGI